jgi:hypothetical protein
LPSHAGLGSAALRLQVLVAAYLRGMTTPSTTWHSIRMRPVDRI